MVTLSLSPLSSSSLTSYSRQLLFLIVALMLTNKQILCQDENVFTNRFAVELKADSSEQDARHLASSHGFHFIGKIGNLENHYLFEHHGISKRSTDHSHEYVAKLKGDERVIWAEHQKIIKRVKRASISQDVPETISDPLFKDQWYINKGAQDGYDMNVAAAWKKGFTGKGVVVTILDDGIQPNHPDLAENYDPLASYDVNSNDPDPTPQDNGDNKHGTRCAGEVAAVAGNDFCGVGIAFNSSIGGVRMLDGVVTDEVEARALGLNPDHVHIYSASWGPEDDGKTVDGPGRLAKRAFIDGIKKGRRGKGSIFVWASGNGGRRDDNCNCDGYTNSIYTLSISSATQSGTKPWYLEECSSTLATTYSSGSLGRDENIVTVDMDTSYFESLEKGWPPDASRLCTKSHTGTSASAPIAAAICALALEANPNLTWRDMQHIVVRTSRYEPLKNENGWFTNAVGRNISHKFGYGLMDAEAMVDLAEKWHPVPPQIICESAVREEKLLIPASFTDQLEVTLNWTGCSGTSSDIRYLEHVQTRVDAHFKPRGYLKITLISPSGTVSNLLTPRVKDMSDNNFEQWPFLSVHFWGEDPRGVWRLIIKNDLTPAEKPGQLISWGITFYGINEPIPNYEDPSRLVRFLPRRIPSKCPKATFMNLETSECVKDCPDGTFGNVETIECTKCSAQCSTCYGPSFDNCITCNIGQYYYADRCLNKCPDGYYADQTGECLPCSSNCKTCTKSRDKCTSCKTNLQLDKLTNKCSPLCTSSTCKNNRCPPYCISCSQIPSSSLSSPAVVCNQCQSRYRLLEGFCSLDSCPSNYYESKPNKDSKSTECRRCHESCGTCSGPSHSQCLSCFNSGPPKDGFCLPCPLGAYFNKLTKSCDLCHESCSSCSGPSPNECVECRFPLFLDSNRCLPCCNKPSSSKKFSSTSLSQATNPLDFNLSNTLINDKSNSDNVLSKKRKQSKPAINYNDNQNCCQCDSPLGPCLVPAKTRSVSSLPMVDTPVNNNYGPKKMELNSSYKVIFDNLINSPPSVIIVICFSSLILIAVIFLLLQTISTYRSNPGGGLFTSRNNRRYQKISDFSSYNSNQNKVILTCDELYDEDDDEEEDKLFEKI